MTPDLTMAIPEPVPTAADPFARGWRYTRGRAKDWRVPLTEDDLVYPEAGDFVVNNQAHNDDREYLVAVFRERTAGRPGLRVLGDHLINFEHPAVRKKLGPDVIVFNGEPLPWNPHRGVFPVKRMKARPLVVVEITSPTTRRKDLTTKPGLYFSVGVPLFVLVDLGYGGGQTPGGIVAYQAGPTEYEPLPPDDRGRVWIEVVEVFLAAENDRVVCYDPDGRRIGDYAEVARQAATEKARADAAEQRMKDLEAELARLRGGTTPST